MAPSLSSRGVILEEIQVVSRNRQPIRRLDSTHLTLAGQSQLLGHAKIVRYDSRKPSRIQALGIEIYPYKKPSAEKGRPSHGRDYKSNDIMPKRCPSIELSS